MIPERLGDRRATIYGIRLRALTTAVLILGPVSGAAVAQDTLPSDSAAEPASPAADELAEPVVPLQIGQAEVLAPSSQLGGAGESCRARSDCESGLRCLANECRDPLEGAPCSTTAECGPHLRCLRQVCQSPFGGMLPPPETLDETEEPENPYVGLRETQGFIGGSLMGAAVLGDGLDGALLGGVRGGIYFRRHEIAVEVTPFSSVYFLPTAVPAFQLNVSYAYLLPMHQRGNVALYWPLRVGVGFLTGITNANVYLEARSDVLGLVLQIDQVVLELHLLSFRVAWTPGYVSPSWWLHAYGGLSASYVF